MVSPEKRPQKRQKVDASTNTGDFSMALDDPGDVNEQQVRPPGGTGNGEWGPNQFGTGGAINYGGPIGPKPNPYFVRPTDSGCSCGGRKKYTCEEKCAYNAQMKEQCKGCRTYFRKNKKWIYPKKKKRSYRKSYRRSNRNSGGLNMNQLLPFMLLR